MSLTIFYTGVVSVDDLVQTDAASSLGGIISTSQVPNGRLNSIFGDVGKIPELGFESEYRCIAIQNNTGGDLTNVSIYLTQPTGTPQGSFELAIVAPSEKTDCPGTFFVETIQDAYSQPYSATFSAPDVGSPGVIASWPNEAYYGVWIKRTTDVDSISSSNSCEFLVSNYNTDLSPTENTLVPQPSLEDFSLVLDY